MAHRPINADPQQVTRVWGTQAPPCFLIAPAAEAEGLYTDIATGGGRGDSGVDLRFPADIEIPPSSGNGGLPTLVNLRVRVRCLSWGYYTAYFLVARSRIGKTPLTIANSVGVIDGGYQGWLMVAVHNHSNAPYRVARGEALFQIVLPGLSPTAARVVALTDAAFAEGASLRGDGGFGSTGAGGVGATAALGGGVGAPVSGTAVMSTGGAGGATGAANAPGAPQNG